MLSHISLPLLGAAALAIASPQAPPDPVLLTSTQSGVDPIVPTPFPGVETIEGAITYDGDPIPGFVGPGGSASVQTNLPSATYQATLPSASNFDENTGTLITGSISGSSVPGGSGVTFTVNFGGFPSAAQYGPFGTPSPHPQSSNHTSLTLFLSSLPHPQPPRPRVRQLHRNTWPPGPDQPRRTARL